MNMKMNETKQEHFSVEDVVVSYSNIEITHANDNKAPVKVTLTKIVVVLVIIALIAGIALV